MFLIDQRLQFVIIISGNGLVLNNQKVIIWNSGDCISWRIYASQGFRKLNVSDILHTGLILDSQLDSGRLLIMS